MPEQTYTQAEVEQIVNASLEEYRSKLQPQGSGAPSTMRGGMKGELVDGLVREFADQHLKYTKDQQGHRQLSETQKKTWGFHTEEYSLGYWDQRSLEKLPYSIEGLALLMSMHMPSMENRYLEILKKHGLLDGEMPLKFTPDTVIYLENLRQLAPVRASRGLGGDLIHHLLDAYSHSELKETPQQVQRGIMDKVFGRH